MCDTATNRVGAGGDGARTSSRDGAARLLAALSNLEAVTLGLERDTSPRDLTELAKHPNGEVRTAVAGNSGTPVYVLRRLAAEERDPKTLAQLAENPSTPADVLTELIGDNQNVHEHVKRGVAANRNTAPDTLNVLAQDPSLRVQTLVAYNEHTPSETLKQLAETTLTLEREGRVVTRPQHGMFSASRELLYGVTYNPNTPGSVLGELAEHEEPYVRTSVAVHPRTPVTALRELASDREPGVRRATAQCVCDAGILEELSKDELAPVREAVATNAHTGAGVLRRLAEDTVGYVREAIAANENTPGDVLEMLAGDMNVAVRRAVFTNVNYQHTV